MPETQQIRWPDRWYYDQNYIRCIVPNCGLVSDNEGLENQWVEIREHCMHASGPEHQLLEIMLRQTKCAIDECNFTANQGTRSYKLRVLFRHEKTAHGTTAMSNICSFVRLAREGRISKGDAGGHWKPEPTCEEFAFYRMKEKVWALPAEEIGLLFQRSGFHHYSEHTDSNLGKILTQDPLTQPDDNPPFWWPVNAEHFLWFCHPHPTDPADHHWRIFWNDLRAKYADGRI